MRGYLASSIGVACAVALSLPLALPASATESLHESLSEPLREAAADPSLRETDLAGSTQSLPLKPLASDRALGAGAAQGVVRQDVLPFALVGVVWDNPEAELHGRVEVRTRAAETQEWSAWQELDTHNNEHAADLDSAERAGGRVRGSTAPLWVGDSDGVEVRVLAEAPEAAESGSGSGSGSDSHSHSDSGSDRAAVPPLPKNLRLELVDPGDEPTPPQGPPADGPRSVLTAEAAASWAVNAEMAPLGASVIPELTKEQTEAELLASRGESAGKPYIGPRPRIITRKGWGADEKLREKNFVYTKAVRAAFVHHSASGNNYRCAQAPSVLRSIYRYHVKSSGWRDFGYNFAVDKCGNIYEGRAGGVAKPVYGAHTLGFNTNSMGIAVLGTYTNSAPPKAALNAVAKLSAWKLGLYGANPKGTTVLKSGGSNLYKKGKKVRLHVISGHRDGFATECPGRHLYNKLGTARSTSAHYQGR
ncbi:peptidoglycan recognition protein family protein [Streptomyces indicus]|uniref:N-acetylmuramoyl-L-alanine amidase n=1 Tax=Streptomyces indicus TaxID=417292 RepID=A0A1G9I2Z2_9ACTN|nr:peptidoglycan recognition protein [Streptomyces indicus]SDL19617.1 N-acetylmuramoyl-L-alanine amidase [Streptomyces indicus]